MSDIQPKDSDSLTNFFEYADTSSCSAEKHDEPVPDDDRSTSKISRSGDEDATSFTGAKETDRRGLSDDLDTRSQNHTDEKEKVCEEPEMSQKDESKSLELAEEEQCETTEHEDTERTGRNDDPLSEEMSGTNAPSAVSADSEITDSVDLPTSEPTAEIPDVPNVDGQVSPTLVDTVESHLQDEGRRGSVEPSDGETSPEVEIHDPEAAAVGATLSTVSSDAPGQIIDDMQVASANGLDVETAGAEQVNGADQPAIESRDLESATVDDSGQKASSPVLTDVLSRSASEQPPDSEEQRTHPDKFDSVTDVTAADAADAVDEVENTAPSEPAAQYALSARDVFIEQQVS